MVPFVVKSGVPFQMGGRDLQPLRQDGGLGAKQIPPAGGGIEAQPLGVLPAQGVDDCPDIPPVSVYLLGYLVKRNWFPVVGEQAMAALLFPPGDGFPCTSGSPNDS